jgi:hypothetical protein
MVTLGADSHQATHTFVAVDETGSKLGHVTLKANADGHLQVLKWARRALKFSIRDRNGFMGAGHLVGVIRYDGWSQTFLVSSQAFPSPVLSRRRVSPGL